MTKDRIYIGAAFLTGLVYRLLMGLQGIDSVDTGFCMTFYENIFSHPYTVTNYFNYFLTGLCGGLWQLTFGQYGLLGFRLLEALTMSAAILLLFLAFKPWLKSTKTCVVAILLSFLFPSTFSTFHYNTLSFLLVAASVYAITRWFLHKQPAWLAAAGLLIGLSFFARFLNFSLVLLALVPFVRGFHVSARRGFANVAIFVGGILTGCLLVVGVVLALGYWSYFSAALGDRFHVFANNEMTYSTGSRIGIYMKSYLDIALQFIAIYILALTYGDVAPLKASRRLAIRSILVVLLFVLVLTSQPYLTAITVCTLLLVTTRHLVWLAFYPLLCAYLFPMGSDDNIQATFFWCGALLIIPAACCYQQQMSKWQRNIISVLCIVIGMLMISRTAFNAKGEEDPRTEMTVIALPGTLNVLTTPERAERYRHEVACIRKYGKANDLMVIANQASELYYATGKRPFTGSTQMGTFTGDELTEQLDYQHRYYGQLPLVVYIEKGHDTTGMEEYRKTLAAWMKGQGYQLVYKDDDLKIFDAVRP